MQTQLFPTTVFSAEKIYKHIYGITYDDNGNEIEADDSEHHDEDACNLTTCPVEAGKKYVLEYRHPLQQSYQTVCDYLLA